MKTSSYNIYIFLYVLISIPGFYFLGLPSLEGTLGLQTYSDSLTYENIARNLYDELPLMAVASNLLGPVELLRFFDYNYVLIYCFNITMMIISIKLIIQNYDINSKIFLFFILFTPLSFFSLFNANKEIFIYLSMAFFLVFLKNKSFFYLFISVILAFLVRWQLPLFFLIGIISIGIAETKGKRIVLLFLLILSLSILYPMLVSNLLEDIVAHSENGSVELVEGSGIFTLLNETQKQVGGYLLTVIPKILQINFGLVKRISMIGEASDFWNYFVLLLHSVFSFILIMYVLFKKRFNLDNQLVFLALLYGFVFAITPIINIRYFLPMYIFLAVAVSAKK